MFSFDLNTLLICLVNLNSFPQQTLALFLPEPSRGPEGPSSVELNSTTNNITWIGLPKEVANGIITTYQVKVVSKENCIVDQSAVYVTFNTTVLLTGLSLCEKYEVSVRGYTVAGPGPYSKPIVVEKLCK